jgi:translation elongation factor EF-Ts
MKEQIIEYSTAKLAKDKGFGNVKPYKLRRDYYNHKGELNGDVTEMVKAICENRDTSEFDTIDAPTQSLLQRWLREDHGIGVIVDVDVTLSWKYKIFSMHPESSYTGDWILSIYMYGWYEEALEKGLVQALELL